MRRTLSRRKTPQRGRLFLSKKGDSTLIHPSASLRPQSGCRCPRLCVRLDKVPAGASATRASASLRPPGQSPGGCIRNAGVRVSAKQMSASTSASTKWCGVVRCGAFDYVIRVHVRKAVWCGVVHSTMSSIRAAVRCAEDFVFFFKKAVWCIRLCHPRSGVVRSSGPPGHREADVQAEDTATRTSFFIKKAEKSRRTQTDGRRRMDADRRTKHIFF
jgi:hypothetical protein